MLLPPDNFGLVEKGICMFNYISMRFPSNPIQTDAPNWIQLTFLF